MSSAPDDTKNAAARVSAAAIIDCCAFLVGPPMLGLPGKAFGILNALYLVFVLMVLVGLAAPEARRHATWVAARGESGRFPATSKHPPVAPIGTGP
jgi:hypothetical protein